MADVEVRIGEWRTFVERRPAVDCQDVEELEGHLRDLIDDLGRAGLTSDEAFLIAVRRIGDVDVVTAEFARERSGRLWKQSVLGADDGGRGDRTTGLAAGLGFAIAAGVTVVVALLVAGYPDEPAWWLGRNAGLLVLPFLAAFFAHRRQLPVRGWLWLVSAFAVAALVINLTPSAPDRATAVLAALHLPVLLWFVVAAAYVGGDLRSHERRMDVVRFTGEWGIYYTLIALGGGVLMGLTVAILQPAGIDGERVVEWVLPIGAAGAVIVAALLVEAKQRVVENMAPVLTIIFTPLFAVMLVVAVVVYAVGGLGRAFDRELLVVFDLLMVVVLGLVLYGMSARDPARHPGWLDRIQLVALIAALALDVMVLGTMLARVGDLGVTPNRAAALGLNLLLLFNLAGAAWLSIRFLAGAGPFHRLERWQTAYLPVFATWAFIVVALFPPLFRFS